MALITGTSTGIDSRTADRVAAERMPCLLHPTSGSAQARTRSDPSQAPDTGRKLVPQPLRARHRGSQDISPRARARSAHQQHLSGTVGASTTNDSGNDRQDSCPPAPSGRWCATRETRASGDDRIRLLAVTPAASASATDQWSGSNSTLPSVAHASFVANPIARSAMSRARKRSSAEARFPP